MATWKTREARNRTKIKVLAFLSESDRRVEGATAADIQSVLVADRIAGPKFADEKVVLAELESLGLVERQQIATRGKAKPYFITDSGLEYLEEATRNAMSSEPGQQGNWLGKEVLTDLHQAIAGIIGDLPEFSNSGDDRIQEVSQQLVEMIGRSATR